MKKNYNLLNNNYKQSNSISKNTQNQQVEKFIMKIPLYLNYNLDEVVF